MTSRLIRRYYSVAEAAEVLGFPADRIRSMAKRGELLGARKLGRDWRIPRASVDPPEAHVIELEVE